MQTICEIAGIDGDVWSLEQEDDRQFLFHTPDADSVGPLNRIPMDEHVLGAMWRASKGAAVVVTFPEWEWA